MAKCPFFHLLLHSRLSEMYLLTHFLVLHFWLQYNCSLPADTPYFPQNMQTERWKGNVMRFSERDLDTAKQPCIKQTCGKRLSQEISAMNLQDRKIPRWMCVSSLCARTGLQRNLKKKTPKPTAKYLELKKKICSKFRGSCKRRMVFVWTDSISPASKRTDSSQKADTNYKTSCAFLNLHAWEMKTLYFIEYCEGLGWRPLMQKWFEFFLDVWQD